MRSEYRCHREFRMYRRRLPCYSLQLSFSSWHGIWYSVSVSVIISKVEMREQKPGKTPNFQYFTERNLVVTRISPQIRCGWTWILWHLYINYILWPSKPHIKNRNKKFRVGRLLYNLVISMAKSVSKDQNSSGKCITTLQDNIY